MLQKISASAGAGKTYTLTNQFLARLDRVTSPLPSQACVLQRPQHVYGLNEILAATFTNKAAAEMRLRIITTLKTAALNQQKQPHTKALLANPEHWVWVIVQNYTALNIRTIDSLLHTLVRLSALSAGLHPDFQPTFDANVFFRPAYDSLMQDLANPAWAEQEYIFSNQAPHVLHRGTPSHHPTWADEHEASPPADLFSPQAQLPPQAHEASPQAHSDPVFYTVPCSTLQKALDQACRNHLLFSATSGFMVRNSLYAPLLGIVNRLLQNQPTPRADTEQLEQNLQQLYQEVQKHCALVKKLLEAENLHVAKHLLNLLQNISQMLPYKSLPKSNMLQKDHLDACLNKQSKGAASEAAYAAFAAFYVACQKHSQLQPIFAGALRQAPLVVLAHELYARIQHNSITSGMVPAISIPSLAARLLQGDCGIADALCRFGSRLLHILLDEFQDTSQEQWSVLYPLVEDALARGGSLTYVGDIKQAIYSWRGGDADLFEAVAQDKNLLSIAQEHTPPPLAHNWRSHANIVAHNNHFFSLLQNMELARRIAAAMLPQNTPEEYIESAALRITTTFQATKQHVPDSLQHTQGAVFLYHIHGDSKKDVAQQVEKQLFTVLQQALIERPCKDFGILVYTTEQSTLIAEWLTRWGVPVITQDSFTLAGQSVVTRLIDFLRFLDYPLNDLAFWQFVSGSECLEYDAHCNQATLLEWLASTCANPLRPPLYQSFKKHFPETWKWHIAPFFQQAGFMTAYDTLFECIRHYRMVHRHPHDQPFLTRLLELAHLAETKSVSSLAAFLQFWETTAQDEKLPLPENMNAIRIMTVHKAKGLEFPVVILPFHHGGKSFEGKLTPVKAQGMELLLTSGKHTPKEYYAACVTEALERLNLLYVAWTRPEEELYAFITQPEGSHNRNPLQQGLAQVLEAHLTLTPSHLYSYTDMRKCEELEQPAESPAPQKNTWAENFADNTNQDLENESLIESLLPQGATLAHLCTVNVPAHNASNPSGSQTSINGGHTASTATSGSISGATRDGLKACANEEEHAAPYQTCPKSAKREGETTKPGSSPHSSKGVCATPIPWQNTTLSQPEGAEWRPMDWLPDIKIHRSVLEDVTLTQARRGTLMHLCLEYLHVPAAQKSEELVLKKAVQTAITLALQDFPLPLTVNSTEYNDLFQGLLWFATLPQATHWLHSVREQSLMNAQGRVFRIDLLVDQGEQGLLAIEYKTGNAYPEHHAQLGNYLHLLTAAQPRPVSGCLVYLDLQQLVTVSP